MFIFLNNIPPDTGHEDIISFIQPALGKSKLNPFGKAGVLEEIKIIGLKDNDLNTLEYHGLLIITPDVIAERVIKLLNFTALRGKSIEVREYKVRSVQNDPRLKSLTKMMTLKERRTGNTRRRANLKVVKNSSYRP